MASLFLCIQSKIKVLGSRPMDHTLALLRQLKYTESKMFGERNPYSDHCSDDPADYTHSDIEMVLVDLL